MSVSRTARFVVTALILALSAAAAWFAWQIYVRTPWTRDGRVRANIVEIAPDISGTVAEVQVRDNQRVKKGDLLVVIDPERYRFALSQAEANVRGREQELEQRKRELERRTRLSSASITAEAREQAETAVITSEAAYDQAIAALNTARLNLDRSEIRSPSTVSWRTCRSMQEIMRPQESRSSPWSTATVSMWSDISRKRRSGTLKEGDPATVQLMGFPDQIRGHVESISRAVADREATPGSGKLIANVNPSFSWVRLAQRVPVRISLDRVPPDVRLSAGMTATVVVHPAAQPKNAAAPST